MTHKIRNKLRPLAVDPWPDVIILILLALLALVPRLVGLGSVPPGLNGDELFNAIDALRVGPGNWPVFFDVNNGREALFIYLMAIPLNLFGHSLWAVRLPAALLGTGSVLLAYGIGAINFHRRVGLLAGALMAVSLWPIMQSRWGLRAVSLTFFTALTVYLYGRAVRSENKSVVTWLSAGAALGLTMYTYIPARLFPVVILGWFAWIALYQGQLFRRIWRYLLLSLLIALIVFAPFGLYMIQNPESVNQRVGGLLETVGSESVENGSALITSLSTLFLMFTFRGDTAGRYHVQARPIFDPVTGIFFYIGLIAGVWLAFRHRQKIERAKYALLLFWMGLMLAPNALLGADTSFLRGAGAMVPIYLLTAIGLETVYNWFRKKWPQRERLWQSGLVGLVVIGLVLIFIDSAQAYFDIWANDPVTRDAYQAELAQIGRSLEEESPTPGVQVFVAYNYVTDTAPQTFRYYNDEPVTWFDYNNSFSWRPKEDETWYYAAASKPIRTEVLSKLDLNEFASQLYFTNGDEAFRRYKLDSNLIDWEPEHPADYQFFDGPQLIGFDWPEVVYRGETITMTTHWQIPFDQQPLPNQLTYIQVQLEDDGRNVWGQTEGLLGYPQASWQGGDRFVQFLTIEIPQGMPPGPLYLRFGLRDVGGRLYSLASNPEERAGPFLVRSRPLPEILLEPDTLVFDQVLALEKAILSTLISPGLSMDIALDWLALKKPAGDYRLRLALARSQNDEPFLEQTFDLWPDVYPPSQWQERERVTTFHRLPIPLDIPTDADPVLIAQLLPPQGNNSLSITQGSEKIADLNLSLREHIFDLPDIEHGTEALLGDSIRLLGYDLPGENYRPGDELALTLYWQASETPTNNYTVFTHLVDSEGQIRGQFDNPPVGEAWLTSTWLPGEVVIDRRTVPVRLGAPAGEYRLLVGLYSASDGKRLPIIVNGELQAGDQLVIPGITIQP